MMKHFLLLFLFVIIFLSSCGPVTPVPVPRATSVATTPVTATRQPPVRATPTPLSLSLSLPEVPSKDSSAYQLKAWTDDDYKTLVEGLNNMMREQEGQIPYSMLPDYVVAFQSERLLKFPNSSAKGEIAWDILLNKPNTTTIPGIKLSSDLMSSIISEMLAQNTHPSDLKSEIEKHGWYVTASTDVSNIVGNGESGLVLMIQIPNDSGLVGVFAVFSDSEKFHVEKIRDWDISQAPAMGRYFELKVIGDTNQNGLPELVVQVEMGGSGIPQTWSEKIDHIEWSPSAGKFVTQTFPVYWQTCNELGEGPCKGDWIFSQDGVTPLLTTQSYWSTHQDCPDLVVQRKAKWDGKQYVSSKPEVLPPVGNLTPECRLAWAKTAILSPATYWDENAGLGVGWKNILAISIIEKSLQNWPSLADKWWGPASRDYFKLRLGLWYEVRGEEGKAKNMLQQVSKKPYIHEFDLASRWATLYLQERAKNGSTQACNSLEDAYWDEYRQAAVPEPSMYNSDELIKTWGFTTFGSLCDVYEMLPVEAQKVQSSSPQLLDAWLDRVGLTLYQSEALDLNYDQLIDRLVLLDTTNSETPDAWTFIATPNGYKAKFISDAWNESDTPAMKIKTFEIGNAYLTCLLFSEGLTIFRVLPDLTVENLLEEYSVKSYEISNVSTQPKVSIEIDRRFEGHTTLFYVWDSVTQTFAEIPDEFALAQTELEKSLYVQQDYQGAIVYIDNFLQKASPEPKRAYACGVDIPGGCEYLPIWYIPYFRYLRGIAQEQLGQTELARQTFYDLWKDFPKNVFGIAASQRLTLIQP